MIFYPMLCDATNAAFKIIFVINSQIIFIHFSKTGEDMKSDIMDVDECRSGTHNCDVNAVCTKTNGGFTCACNDGFNGDGTSCTGI